MAATLIVADRVRTAERILGDALLVESGRVAAVGDAASLRLGGAREISYENGVVVPGLRDAHFHPIAYTAALNRLVVKQAPDLDHLIRLVRDAAADLPRGAALVGTRLDDQTLAERRLPTREELDVAVPDRPLLLYRYCGHVAVANTTALEAAGVGPATPDPVGGSIDRDRSGVPTGVLRETAVALVAGPLGGRGRDLQPEEVLAALRGLPSLGLTSLGAIVARGEGPWCSGVDELPLLLEIASDLPLKLTVLVIAGTVRELDDAAHRLERAGPRLRFLGLKDFADGSFGGHTAAMRRPYADRPRQRGTLRLDPAVSAPLARTALDRGGKVAVHAIGDLAAARVLDFFDDLLAGGAPAEALRMEHASVLTPAETARLAATGVTASIQPAFLASEAGWLEARLGRDRLRHTYPFATLARAGIPLAGGSDCPVEPPDPKLGVAVARHRAGVTPEEALDGAAALALFTSGAARANGEPPPLQVGSPADFTVLDRDPVEVSAEEVEAAKVLATWVDGTQAVLPSPGSATWLG